MQLAKPVLGEPKLKGEGAVVLMRLHVKFGSQTTTNSLSRLFFYRWLILCIVELGYNDLV